MHIGVPILAVVGHQGSGKTTVIEGLVSELTRKHFQVATAKHISQKGFSMDTKGKDTWRHSEAGADPVFAVSDTMAGIIIKHGVERFSLEKIVKFAYEEGANVLILEGFSSMVLKDRGVGKVVCLRNMDEYEEFRARTRGEVIAFCSFQVLGEPILKIGEDPSVLIERTLKFIEKKAKISEILSSLAGLDCRKCGRASCEELAEDIYEDRADLNDCVLLNLGPKLKAKITVEGSEVPIQPFVSEIIRKSVLGMISTLKGISIRGDEDIHIAVSRKTVEKSMFIPKEPRHRRSSRVGSGRQSPASAS